MGKRHSSSLKNISVAIGDEVCEEDKQLNDQSLVDGSRLLMHTEHSKANAFG